MQKSLLFKIVVLVFGVVGTMFPAAAQVTTATLTGVIRESHGALPGASVKATHVPTGTVYTSTTSANGRYTISNMRTGGPYTVEVTFVGYQGYKEQNIVLKLGDNYVLNAELNDGSAQQLDEIVVSAKSDKTFNSKHIGAGTNISKGQLEKLPSLSRSLTDFTRLTPQAGNGSSFSGTNNRYNSISIDGAVNNDVFGLAPNGAPGGQAGAQPISLDAIQEIQVVLSPYDVTNGNFAGGGINAVTRSGTNRVEGSAYVFTRNENLTGKSIDGLKTKVAPFTNTTYGFRLGAPIIKNKLFLFVNAEKVKITQPTNYNPGDAGAITLDEANTIASTLLSRYGYDAGTIGQITNETKNDKIFARLDWNINANNQLTLRHQYIKASNQIGSRLAGTYRFGNNGYSFNDNQNNSVLELRSKISETLSNNLILGFSRIRDSRDANGQLFPQIRINGLSGNNIAYFGSDASSTANSLAQNVYEFTDNFKILAGKHTFTVGTHNEFFKFSNVFINNFAGAYTYNTLADFVSGTVKPVTAASSFSIVPGDTKPASKFSAGQLGFYFQDEIDAFQGFKLTVGLRADVPMMFDTPPANPLVASTFNGVRTDQTPQRRVLMSPRLGFNWDLTGDRAIQLRGGVALLTSRAPFVWLSNGFANNGLVTGQINATNSTGTFIADPTNQQAAGGTVAKTYEVNVINKTLKLPQTWRSNVALDVKLPGGVLATLEAIYSKTQNNIIYSNINLVGSTSSIPAALTGGADTRPLFNYSSAAGKVNSTFTNVFYLDNTNQGSSYSLTAQLQKGFDFGLNASVAYTYGQSHDVNSGASSTASSNTNFVQTTTGPNNPPLSVSNFDIRHRIVGSLDYVIRYGKQKSSGTTISLVYVGKSGTPFTYLYNGDLNNDGATANDLLYVPRNASEIKLSNVTTKAATATTPAVVLTAAQQWADLDAFINADPYLKNMRGKYTVRNGARTPWEHQFDLRIMQDLGTVFKGSKNVLQISMDIINVGNLLNKDWGMSYYSVVSNQASTLVNYLPANGGSYTFIKPTTPNVYPADPFYSRWQGQIGIRYLFN